MDILDEKTEFDNDQYVSMYAERALARMEYTKTMVIDIKNELGPQRVKNTKKILDIGCGIGDLTACLKEVFTNAEIIGIDCSKAMVNYARKTFTDEKIGFKLSSIEEFYGKEDDFDLIVSQYSFGYWDHKKALPNIQRLLKHDGMGYIRNLNPEVSQDILNDFASKYCVSDEERNEFISVLRGEKTIDDCRNIFEDYPSLNASIRFFSKNSKYNNAAMSSMIKDKMINYNIIIEKR